NLHPLDHGRDAAGVALATDVQPGAVNDGQAAGDRHPVPALLAADAQVGQAHVDEGLTRELVLGAFDLLQAQDVRGVFGDETGDLIDAQADRADVPGDD